MENFNPEVYADIQTWLGKNIAVAQELMEALVSEINEEMSGIDDDYYNRMGLFKGYRKSKGRFRSLDEDWL